MKRMMGVLALALAVGAMGTNARGEIKDLLPRVPAEANAIVAVNVNAVLGSAVAKAQGWGGKNGGPLFLQPGTSNVVIAADVNLATMDSAWETGLLEMSKAVSMDGIAMSERGLTDTLGKLPAVWSSRKAYFILLDKQILGISSPDDRQFAVRWVRQQVGATRPVITKYLQDAAMEVTGKTGIVMGLDLGDAVGLNKVRKALMSSLSRAALLKDTPVDTVAQLLVTLQGIRIKMEFGDDIMGQIGLDFEKSPAVIASIAPGLLKDALTGYGMGLSDLDTWTATTDGNKLVFTGKLTVAGFQQIMTLIEPPAPGSTDAPVVRTAAAGGGGAGVAAAAGGAADADPQASVIAASQKYYKSVSATLDSFSQATSTGAGATWLKHGTQHIDKLPMVNVDPDLVKWGTEISASLLNAAQLLGVGQANITAAAAARGSSQPGAAIYSTDNYGNLTATQDAQTRAEYAQQHAAMQQASQAARASTIAPVGQILAETLASRSKIRAVMVQRYKAEF